MKLILENIEIRIAAEIIKDDAFELWLKAAEIKELETYHAAPCAFYAKDGILKGYQYLHIEFADVESGEILEMNAMGGMHKAMVKYKLYPEVMLKGIERSERKFPEFYCFGIGRIFTYAKT